MECQTSTENRQDPRVDSPTPCYASFDIGFIPKGWTKGEKLRVVRPTETTTGFIAQNCREIGYSFDPTRDYSTDIAYMRFDLQEVSKADTWLDWWKAEA